LERLLTGAAEFLYQSDIFAVWDTRNSPTLTHLFEPCYKAFPKKEVKNTIGHGACVFVANRVAHMCQFLGYHSHIPLAWLKVGGIFVGFIYAKPSLIGSIELNTEFLAFLHADVAKYQAKGQVAIIGDFNAHIGTLPDAYTTQRTCARTEVDDWGKLLMDMVAGCGMVTSTGRLDIGQVSFQTAHGSSRIDHAFFDSALFHDIQDWQVFTNMFGSDHYPLVFTVPVTCDTPRTRQSKPYLRWNYLKKDAYVMHVLQNDSLLTRIDDALHRGDINCADTSLRQLIWSAATSAGMVVTPSVNEHKPLRRLPLSAEARVIRAQVTAFRHNGLPVPAHIRSEWRAHVKAARKLQTTQHSASMQEALRSQPRLFWQRYNHNVASSCCILPTTEWLNYFRGKFGNPAQVHAHGQVGTSQHIGPRASHTDTPCHIPQHDSCPLMRPVTTSDVAKAFKRLGTNKATGCDGVPAEFLTKASLVGSDDHVIHDIFARMCNLVVQQGDMPHAWKVKAITPTFKKGDRTVPSNYRPIAVATTFYRVITSIFGARLSTYLQSSSRAMVLDSQFGFRKDLSTDHAHLVLTTCCQLALANKRKMAVVKLDISKAYDTVVRDLLWASMQETGLPDSFVCLMKLLYHDAAYVVHVNGELSGEFTSTMGLQQGCALSPQSYNLYLRDLLMEIERECRSMGINLFGIYCVQVNYADDITGTVELERVGDFIQIVERVLERKNQMLSREKCRVMVVSHEPSECAHIHGIPVVQHMKVLGVIYTHNMSWDRQLAERSTKGSSKNILHVARLRKYGCTHNIKIASLMLDGDVRPTLLFGAFVWGHHKLAYTDPVTHTLQSPYSVLQRTMLGLPHTTAHWIVSLLTGHLPIQHWLSRDFMRAWNKTLNIAASNQLVKHALIVQVRMVRRNERCWLKSWCDAFHRLIPDATPSIRIRHLLSLDESVLLQTMHDQYIQILTHMGDPFQHDCPHKRIALTYQLLNNNSFKLGKVPPMLHYRMPEHVQLHWISFLAANATLPIHAYPMLRFHFSQRICRKCIMGVHGDEAHVLLQCTSTQQVRSGFSNRLLFPAGGLAHFVHVNSSKLLPFFVHACMRAYHEAPNLHVDLYPLEVLPTLQLVFGDEGDNDSDE
jgi:Reverse transcriptase (RNA-dependent DNA polymerase)